MREPIVEEEIFYHFKEPLKKDFFLSFDLGRIESCEALRGADVALFRDPFRKP